uniref:SH3 domain-containing protein n=1 Tax=Parastrongyloides trichosuri TaxID=131310 RepID=A0A0N4Z3M7_PARTI
MFLFGESVSQYDEDVQLITSEDATIENWGLMMDLCDRINAELKEPKHVKSLLTSVKKRLNHREQKVIILAVALLDALWNNCPILRKEIAEKKFVEQIRYLCTGSDFTVGEKMRIALGNWVKNECTKDLSFALLVALYNELKEEGFSFENETELAMKKAREQKFNENPDYVTSPEEEEALMKAIALSLEDADSNTKVLKNNDKSMYPNVNSNFDDNNRDVNNVTPMPATSKSFDAMTHPVEKKVRVLYDFEAGEDNELTIFVNDMVTVTDDSDANWWMGYSSRGKGLFPASFVTTELENEKEELFDTSNLSKVPVLDMEILDKCIALFEDLDPADSSTDPPELIEYEMQAEAMAPLVDEKIVEIDSQLMQLTELNAAIRNALAIYDEAVHKESQINYTMQNGTYNQGWNQPINNSIPQQTNQYQGPMVPQQQPMPYSQQPVQYQNNPLPYNNPPSSMQSGDNNMMKYSQQQIPQNNMIPGQQQPMYYQNPGPQFQQPQQQFQQPAPQPSNFQQS